MILQICILDLVMVKCMKLLDSIFIYHCFNELFNSWQDLSFIKCMIFLIVLLLNSLLLSLQICRFSMSKTSINEVSLKIVNDLFFFFIFTSIKLKKMSSKINSLDIFIVISKLIRVFLNQVFCLFRNFMLLSF